MELFGLKLVIFVAMCCVSVTYSASAKDVPAVTSPTTEKNVRLRIADIDFPSIMDDCNITYPVEVEFITSLNETGSFPDETQTIPKCFVRCYYEYSGMMDGNGNFNMDMVKQYFTMTSGSSVENEIIEKIVEACGEDRFELCPCDKAYYTNRCIMENIMNTLKDN